MKKRDSSPKAARIATASLSVLLAVAIGTTCGATSYRSLICSTIGGTMYKTIDKANAEPLQASTDNGMSLDEWKKAADQLVEDVTSEGIVLLKNQNQTLPLAKGSKVTLFGRSSVDLVLGGTGAGNINTDYVVDLKSAMGALLSTVQFGISIKPTMEKTAMSAAMAAIWVPSQRTSIQQKFR